MASATEVQRLFFALWPDDSLRRTLYKVTRRPVRLSGGRPVPPTNFHITLAFLGSLDTAGGLLARQAADSVVGRSFELQLDRLGFWPEPGMLWLGAMQVPLAVQTLAADLAKALRLQGLAPDSKPFVPHVTLARKVVKPGELGTLRPLHWPVREFALLSSLTHARGSEYRPLAFWPLGSKAAGSREL
ncbi:MAG: RNA 2',3'-cyclic phosphodiesterase [Gammaproteobacteria bacterium]|nr:RNA 2',3'-cyclic phosphodiesterase [Gammaproteobacteria bacterium]